MPGNVFEINCACDLVAFYGHKYVEWELKHI